MVATGVRSIARIVMEERQRAVRVGSGGLRSFGRAGHERRVSCLFRAAAARKTHGRAVATEAIWSIVDGCPMPLPHVPSLQLVARIAVGAVLGGIIGFERGRHGRPVGLRTHAIVAMTAATFMVVSSQFVYFQGYAEGDHVDVDGSRIAASVVSAIGFLAGGTILRSGLSVQGLTTAAGLWLVTAIGLAAGGGMFEISVAVTVMGVLALTVLRRIEGKDDSTTKRKISVVLGETIGVSELSAAAASLGGRLENVEYDRRLDAKRRVSVTCDVVLPIAVEVPRLIEVLESTEGVRRLHVHA
jgi:putative Mg2+ transporter-C (MgtC) family protein